MLTKLILDNVGPLPNRSYDFGKRINAFTGDNGLGKTFLLDLVWFSLTNTWPAEENPAMTGGFMAQPGDVGKPASIKCGIKSVSNAKLKTYTSNFDRDTQRWKCQKKMQSDSNVAVYSLSDGSFCVWDPVRNGYRKKEDNPNYEPSFSFTPFEIWNGQYKFDRTAASGTKQYCLLQGIIADWRLWQTDRNSKEFPALRKFLEMISSEDMKIGIGDPRKTSLDEVREMPTLRLPYGDVPIQWASAAFRRILTLAYILVWAYSEHVKACHFVGKSPTRRVTLLVDELDAHLHPKWQRMVMPALKSAVETMVESFDTVDSGGGKPDVQIITSTHSPLVMASLEDIFDARLDKWLDFDISGNCHEVQCEDRPFERRGGADDWLRSPAFDLKSTRSKEMEQMLNRASEQLQDMLEKSDEKLRLSDAAFCVSHKREIRKLYAALARKLPPTDRFLQRFRLICEAKEWKVQ